MPSTPRNFWPYFLRGMALGGVPLGSMILSYQPTLNLTARVLAGEELVVIQWGKWYEKARVPGQLSKVTPFDDIRPLKTKGYKSMDLMDLKKLI